MPPTVESIAAQGQPQDLRYANMGYYDMANDHEYHDHVINNFAGIAPAQAQAQAAPPAPVCTDLNFLHTYLTRPFAGGDLHIRWPRSECCVWSCSRLSRRMASSGTCPR